nr:zinc finger, CCHC-type [Tanacetum cinerariifolium]
FYVTERNEFVSINSIIESRDTIFDDNRFSSIPKLSQRSLINGTDDIGVSEVPKKVYEELVVQQPELRKGKKGQDSKVILT